MVVWFRRCWAKQVDIRRKYHPDKHSLTFLTSAVIQFFHRTLWFTMLYYQTKSGCKQTSSLEDIVEIVLFTVTLTLKIVNHLFCLTLCLMIIHNHTKFGINFEQFRRYWADTIRHMDRSTDRQSDSTGNITQSAFTNSHWKIVDVIFLMLLRYFRFNPSLRPPIKW